MKQNETKKVVARFGKKQRHDADDPREQSITAVPEEEPITEDSKKTLSRRTLERIISMRNLKRTLSL